MQPTKPWSLLAIAAISAAVAWIVVKFTFSSLAPLPWTAVPALILLAIGEFGFARNIGPRLHGRPGAKPIQPMAVPRVVALAKASSAAGAAIGGLALGFLIYTIPLLDKPVPGHDALASAVTMLAAIALVLAALYLERACRAPEPPDDDDADLPSSNGQRERRS
ncbi:MAG TPA: DUF3180 domain-containing protein [Streptosporangiaceae bacterium]|nr:DUF3180 domain-containing protein [Streptosporangiaceae bacterium]